MPVESIRHETGKVRTILESTFRLAPCSQPSRFRARCVCISLLPRPPRTLIDSKPSTGEDPISRKVQELDDIHSSSVYFSRLPPLLTASRQIHRLTGFSALPFLVCLCTLSAGRFWLLIFIPIQLPNYYHFLHHFREEARGVNPRIRNFLPLHLTSFEDPFYYPRSFLRNEELIFSGLSFINFPSLPRLHRE